MKSLKYSLAYLGKNRGNVVSRLLSLSLGIAVAILIFSYVGFVLTYDRFLPDRDRIYQVWMQSPQFGMSDKMFLPMAPSLKADMPQIESAVHLISRTYQIESGGETYDVEGLLVGTEFFDVLDFGVVSGDAHRVLSAEGRGTAMISERLARKLFGHGDPLGQPLMGEGREAITVGGIFRTPPANNSLGSFDMLMWLSYDPADGSGWNGGDSFPSYIKLVEGADIAQVEDGVEGFVERHGMTDFFKEWNVKLLFLPVTQSHFVLNTVRQMQYLLSAVGFVALMVACLNYVMLSISSLSRRSRTIAVLRCNGAGRGDVFSMLLWETLLLVAASVAMAAFVIFCLASEIRTLLGYDVAELFALRRIWIPFVVCIAAFLLSGIIPAALFSAVDLQYAFRGGSDNRTLWKRSLLFVQIACTTGVVLFLGISVRQLDYVRRADYGYEYGNVVTAAVPARISVLRTLCGELRALPEVEEAGLSFSLPVWNYSGQPAKDESGKLLFSCRWEVWDSHYVPTMEMEIVEGRNLNETDGSYAVLVNETYAANRGWTGSAVGREIYDGDGPFEIVGVVKDFRMAGGDVMPIVCHNAKYVCSSDSDKRRFMLSVRLNRITPEALKKVAATIDGIYDESYRYTLTPYSEEMELLFTDQRQMRNGMLLVCAVTLVIALSGLVGYVDNEMQRRRKEIAIRKVAGASAREVMVMLGGNMAWIVLPAVAVGTVMAIYAGDAYLKISSVMRCTLPWWFYAAGTVLVMAVVYGIQVFRTWRTACANPIDMIKGE